MICAKCDRNMVNCICEDADSRIQDLLKSPYIDPNWIKRIIAQRHLNKFDIERAKTQTTEPK